MLLEGHNPYCDLLSCSCVDLESMKVYMRISHYCVPVTSDAVCNTEQRQLQGAYTADCSMHRLNMDCVWPMHLTDCMQAAACVSAAKDDDYPVHHRRQQSHFVGCAVQSCGVVCFREADLVFGPRGCQSLPKRQHIHPSDISEHAGSRVLD